MLLFGQYADSYKFHFAKFPSMGWKESTKYKQYNIR